MKIMLPFLLSLSLISCETTQFEKELTKAKNCWVLTDYPVDGVYSNEIYGGNSFLPNGKITVTWVNHGRKQEAYDFENRNPDESEWEFSEDSILSFYDYKFKVLEFSRDTIIVVNTKYHKKQCFINMPYKTFQ